MIVCGGVAHCRPLLLLYQGTAAVSAELPGRYGWLVDFIADGAYVFGGGGGLGGCRLLVLSGALEDAELLKLLSWLRASVCPDRGFLLSSLFCVLLLQDVAKASNRYPVINVEYHLSKKDDIAPNESLQCTVTLERDCAVRTLACALGKTCFRLSVFVSLLYRFSVTHSAMVEEGPASLCRGVVWLVHVNAAGSKGRSEGQQATVSALM